MAIYIFFLCTWVGWEREIRNASPKKWRSSILGSPSMGNMNGSAAGRRNTDASFEQWIASLCRATLFNVGEMAQVVENIYF